MGRPALGAEQFLLNFSVGGLAFDLIITGPASALVHAPRAARKWAFTSHQEDLYVKETISARPAVRSLILLAKHWMKSRNTTWSSLKGPESFFMELLCIETAQEHPQMDDPKSL